MKASSLRLEIILVITGLIIFGCAEVRKPDWKVYFSGKHGTFSYDAENITRPSKNLVQVWVKHDYTLQDIIEMVETFGEDFKNVDKTVTLEELNCTSKEICLLQLTHYSKGGGVLFSGRERRCKFMTSDTNADLLYKAVCK